MPRLRDLDQPFPFNIKLYSRPYRFEFYDTASPENYTLLKPAVIILCYDISSPASLKGVHTRWKYEVETHFNYDETLPVILLGLKRDVRQKDDYDGRVRQLEGDQCSKNNSTAPWAIGGRSSASDRLGAKALVGEEDEQVLNGRSFVYPQEALRVAQEMRCDRYCECSAVTGEVSGSTVAELVILVKTLTFSCSYVRKSSKTLLVRQRLPPKRAEARRLAWSVRSCNAFI